MKRRKQWCLIHVVRMLKKYMCTALDLHVQRWPSVLSLRFIAIWNIPVEGRVDVELLLLSMAAIKHHFMINRDKMNMHDHNEKKRFWELMMKSWELWEQSDDMEIIWMNDEN